MEHEDFPEAMHRLKMMGKTRQQELGRDLTPEEMLQLIDDVKATFEEATVEPTGTLDTRSNEERVSAKSSYQRLKEENARLMEELTRLRTIAVADEVVVVSHDLYHLDGTPDAQPLKYVVDCKELTITTNYAHWVITVADDKVHAVRIAGF